MTFRAALSSKPFRRVLLTTLAVVTLVGAGTGTAGASTATAPGAATAATGKAWVRAAHLIPGVGAARVDLTPAGGGTSAAVQMSPSASYGDVTSYQRLTPGTYTITVRDSGADLSATPMLSRSLTIAGDKAYTLAMLGTAASPRLATLTDDLTPPGADQARVRVLPAAGQAPRVSVVAKSGPTLVDNAVLGQASGYTAVPAGRWRLTASTSAGAEVADTIKVASGSVYTLLLLDGTAGKPRLALITDAAGTTAAPKGGAATGGGGMADQVAASSTAGASTLGGSTGLPWGLLGLVGLVGLGLLGLLRLGLLGSRRRARR